MGIGKLSLNGRFVLAPMADRTDIAFRHLCRGLGAALVFCEFASAEGILRSERYARKALRTLESEKPVGVQIFGEDAKIMGEACRKINQMGGEGVICPDLIDLNFGCPGRNVVGAGAGSALLKNPEKIAGIVSECARNSELPVTAKIRMPDSDFEKTVALAKMVERAGASALTVHARTVKTGKSKAGADWSVISEVKKSVSIPVIGNGGADSAGNAVRMLQETSCDFVMVARGALYNPRIFAHANEMMEGKEGKENPEVGKRRAFFEYLELARKLNCLDLRRIKLHANDLCFGLKKASSMRERIGKAGKVEELEAVFREG